MKPLALAVLLWAPPSPALLWTEPAEAYDSGFFSAALADYGESLARGEGRALPLAAKLLGRLAWDCPGAARKWQGWAAAEALHRDGHPDAALSAFSRLAEAGNVLAMLRLSHQYAEGIGTAANQDEARRWFEQATSTLPSGAYPLYGRARIFGDAETRLRLAQMYIYGAGVRENYTAAAELLRELAAGAGPEAEEAREELAALQEEGWIDEDAGTPPPTPPTE